ncbi:MAG: hypothetical protein ACJ754_07905, partial [Pyrinomonadaceae bacterium]
KRAGAGDIKSMIDVTRTRPLNAPGIACASIRPPLNLSVLKKGSKHLTGQRPAKGLALAAARMDGAGWWRRWLQS